MIETLEYTFIVNRANYDWGVQYHVMEENGRGFGEAYYHHDEKESFTLQGLINDTY
ncbi:hypothetical protein J0X14_14290 [Muricauda sp. CAU 1633]|uniref:hypothetical protein n=1 Tax=Allomuricauda sp. CAU 1633 TaxID=2816036 RepID=UPI001A8E5688|nr:hypothetical protein [Muricauda sp. CAU 1633]MBO0323474.1 hypothetical protein [Muricauda sp. CAU 1633]